MKAGAFLGAGRTEYLKGAKLVQPFTERVIRIIQPIPSGHVMTYGQIARLAGNSWGARQVARILHSMSCKYRLPWHRVINSRGEIAGEIMND